MVNVGLKTNSIIGLQAIKWSDIIQSDEFTMWADKNLTKEEQAELIDKDKYFQNLANYEKASGEVEDQYALMNADRIKVDGGKYMLNQFSLSPAMKDARNSLSYDNKFKGDGTVDVYNFQTKQVEKNKGNLIILDEIALNIDLEYMDKGIKPYTYAYVTTVVAMTKEQMEGKVFLDNSGGETSYEDIYANDENKLSNNMDNPAVNNWLKNFKVGNADDLDDRLYKNALKTAAETYLVQVVIRQNYDNFVKDTDYAMKDKNAYNYNKKIEENILDIGKSTSKK
jgi:hypothetical protein